MNFKLNLLFTVIISLFIKYQNIDGLKIIKLWRMSKICRDLFNKKILLDTSIKNKINYSSVFNLTQHDIDIFPTKIAMFPNYNETIYRGIYEHDELYNQLKYEKAVKTQEYYSFTKNISKATMHGEKIIFVLKTDNNFDISNYSTNNTNIDIMLDNDVILNKSLILQLLYEKKQDNYIFVNLLVIKN